MAIFVSNPATVSFPNLAGEQLDLAAALPVAGFTEELAAAMRPAALAPEASADGQSSSQDETDPKTQDLQILPASVLLNAVGDANFALAAQAAPAPVAQDAQAQEDAPLSISETTQAPDMAAAALAAQMASAAPIAPKAQGLSAPSSEPMLAVAGLTASQPLSVALSNGVQVPVAVQSAAQAATVSQTFSADPSGQVATAQGAAPAAASEVATVEAAPLRNSQATAPPLHAAQQMTVGQAFENMGGATQVSAAVVNVGGLNTTSMPVAADVALPKATADLDAEVAITQADSLPQAMSSAQGQSQIVASAKPDAVNASAVQTQTVAASPVQVKQKLQINQEATASDERMPRLDGSQLNADVISDTVRSVAPSRVSVAANDVRSAVLPEDSAMKFDAKLGAGAEMTRATSLALSQAPVQGLEETAPPSSAAITASQAPTSAVASVAQGVARELSAVAQPASRLKAESSFSQDTKQTNQTSAVNSAQTQSSLAPVRAPLMGQLDGMQRQEAAVNLPAPSDSLQRAPSVQQAAQVTAQPSEMAPVVAKSFEEVSSTFVSSLVGGPQRPVTTVMDWVALQPQERPAAVVPHEVRLDSGAVQLEIQRMVKQGGGHVVMELTPPDQSKFTIELRLDERGGAIMVVEGVSDSTRTRLEQSAPQLHEQFQQMGLSLQLDMRQNRESNASGSQERAPNESNFAANGPEPKAQTIRAESVNRAREKSGNQVYLYA